MNPLLAYGARYHPHSMEPPGADGDGAASAPAGGEEGGVLGGVQGDLDYALYVLVSGRDAAIAEAEAPGDGEVDPGRVEELALDGTGLDHVGGEGLESSLLPEVKAQGLHAAQEVAL